LGGEGEEAAARHEREVDMVIEVSISTFELLLMKQLSFYSCMIWIVY
jgi:hypothetical protein